MTSFMQAASPVGVLYLPPEFLSPPPGPEAQWRDQEFLAMSGEQMAAADEDATLDALGAARRLRARADALEARALARLDRLRGGSRYVPDEAALELRVSPHTAADRVARANTLVRRMPRLLAAMDAGDIEAYPAGKITDTVRALTDDQAREVDARLADKIENGRLGYTDPSRLVRAARRLVNQVDPDGQAARAREARTGRKVELIPGEDTMSRLVGEIPAEDAASAYARIDGMARRLRNTGDQRTLDQLRADVYADLLLGHNPGVSSPAGAAMVFLHLPIDTALTLSDDGCELAGYGPLPGPIARDIMTNKNSVWRKVLTDPATGAPLDVGRTRRHPSQAIRDFVAVRDRECPYCHRPAQRCDFDHLQDWGKHGGTSGSNGGPKCERHHRLKDEPGWTLEHDPDTGTATITTPAGRTHTIKREPIIEPPASGQDADNSESDKDPPLDDAPF